MRRFWLILAIMLFSCSKAELPVAPELKTQVNVLALTAAGEIIEAAKVYLDGKLVGTTPYESTEVGSGEHLLSVTKEGYQAFVERFDLEEGGNYKIEAVLNLIPPKDGELLVTINIDSALITIKNSVDEVVVETTERSSIHTLKAGAYVVRGEKEGCVAALKAVEVAAGKSVTVNLEIIVPNATPPSLQFSVAEDSVEFGEPISLAWQTDGYQVIIDQGVGTRGPSGNEKIVLPTAGLTVFTATAFSHENLTTELTDSVYVAPKTSVEPFLTFTIQQDTVQVGESFNLHWQSDGYQVIIDSGVGTRGPNGTEQLVSSAIGLTIFTATAYNTDNVTTQKRDSIFVAPSMDMYPTLTLSFAQDTVAVGTEAELKWQSDGYQVIIDNGIGTRGPGGAEKIVFHTPGMKVLTATAFGQANLTTQRQASVYAKEASLPPTLEFSVHQKTVAYGEPVTISWQSDGYEVVIDQGVGTRGPSGSEEVDFANPGMKIFTATAYGADNLMTMKIDSVLVEEAELPSLPVLILSTTRRVTVGDPATIAWQSHNADYIVIDYVDGAALEGSEEVTFATPGIRMVTATAFNPSGYVSAMDTIEVVVPDVKSVNDILLAVSSVVRADQGESGYVDSALASFEVETEGNYDIFSEVWYNSGDAQLNESFYLQIRDAAGNVIYAQNANAGLNRVVADEPGEPHVSTRESGIFALAQGSYTIDVVHYAKISTLYPQHLNGPIVGTESVKVLGFKLVCL